VLILLSRMSRRSLTTPTAAWNTFVFTTPHSELDAVQERKARTCPLSAEILAPDDPYAQALGDVASRQTRDTVGRQQRRDGIWRTLPLAPSQRAAAIQAWGSPPEAAFAYQPWRTPIQKRVAALQKEIESLQKTLVQRYNDVHLRMYLLDVLKPVDYVSGEGGSLDSSLLYWMCAQFEQEGHSMDAVQKLRARMRNENNEGEGCESI
jgi:hypothetical protein